MRHMYCVNLWDWTGDEPADMAPTIIQTYYVMASSLEAALRTIIPYPAPDRIVRGEEELDYCTAQGWSHWVVRLEEDPAAVWRDSRALVRYGK